MRVKLISISEAVSQRDRTGSIEKAKELDNRRSAGQRSNLHNKKFEPENNIKFASVLNKKPR